MSEIFHKPAHEPYFLPFTSIHAEHIKNSIPFVAPVRAIRYCSTYVLHYRLVIDFLV